MTWGEFGDKLEKMIESTTKWTIVLACFTLWAMAMVYGIGLLP